MQGNPSRLQAALRYVYILAFLLMLLLPVGLTALRNPSAIREVTAEGENLFEQADSAMKSAVDWFWTKPLSMRAVAAVDYALFNRTISAQTFLGKEGQLFYKGDAAVDNRLGQYTVAPETLDAICEAQQGIADRLTEMSVTYMVVICPAKEYVYTDKLPGRYLQGGDSNRKTQIVQALSARTDVTVLDLTDALIDEYQAHPVYLNTDSHWNNHGSFRAVEEIVRALQTTYPDLALPRREDYDFLYTQTSGQNLAQLSYLDRILLETDGPLLTSKYGWNWVLTAPEVPYEDPGRPGLLGPSTALIRCVNPANAGKPNVMMISDSFAGAPGEGSLFDTIGLLTDSVHTCIRYHYYYATVNTALVEIEQSDVVIQMLLESNLEYLARPITTQSVFFPLDTALSFTEAGGHTALPHFTTQPMPLDGGYALAQGYTPAAAARLQAPAAGDLALRLDFSAGFFFPDAGEELSLYVNDVFIDTLPVSADTRTITFAIPLAALGDSPQVFSFYLAYADAEEAAGGIASVLALESLTLSEIGRM